jgi:uncharacterized membrane protein
MEASTRRSIDGEAPGRRGAADSPPEDGAGMVAFLGAFCFFLSAVEYMVPKPLPFMRLGIANLPILIGAGFLSLPSLLALALVKAIGMSLISGTLFSYVALFSLSGTVAAALAMRAAMKAPRGLVSRVGASVLGAVASNAAQLTLAYFIVFHEAARLVAPPFMAAGLVTGLALGVFAELFAERSAWLALVTGIAPYGKAPAAAIAPDGAETPGPGPRAEERPAEALDPRAARRAERRSRWEAAVPPGPSAIVGILSSLAFLFPIPLPAKAALFALFVAAAWLAGKRISWTATLLTSAGIVAANLLVPVGKVIASIGPLKVTEAALLDGIDKALVFEGLLYASKAFVRRGLRLRGRLGRVLASAFESYDMIVEYKGRMRPSTLIGDADALALEIWGEGPAGVEGRARSLSREGRPH